MSRRKVYAFGGLWTNTYVVDIQTKMLIFQLKINLDEKILLFKITHLYEPTIRKMALRGSFEGFISESRIPRSILVHTLCGIEVYNTSFRKAF